MNSIILGEHDARGESAILLDNLSLFMAARLLRLDSNHHFWDLEAKQGVDASVFAEVCGLSVLVDALVMFDKIYVQSDFADRWVGALKELSPIVTLVDILPSERATITEYVKQRSTGCAFSEHFRKYIASLEAMDLEGVVLRSARHYHANDLSWIEYAATHLGTDVEIGRGGIGLGLGDEALKVLGGYEGDSIVPEMALILATGAFFHQAVASRLGVGYLPHAFRQPFSVFDDWRSRAVVGVSYAPIRLLEDARRRVGETVNAQLGDSICDLYIPALFSMVLKRAGSPDTLLREAIEIRNSGPAQAFRAWLTNAVALIRDGQIFKLRLILNAVDELVKEMAGEIVRKVNLKISITPSMEVPVSTTDVRRITTRMDLRFLKSLWASIGEAAVIEEDLRRLWGKAIEDRISDLQKGWRWLRIDPVQLAKEEQRRGSN
ncbi:MAG: hypothetical protein LAO78_11250 [Acidobacteriia bacterium]|nr:hypothetical protein [Terriglobia bacterium]